MDLSRGQRSETGYTQVHFSDPDEARIFALASPHPREHWRTLKRWSFGRKVRQLCTGQVDEIDIYVRDSDLQVITDTLRMMTPEHVPALYGHGETAEASSARGADIARRLGRELLDYSLTSK